MWEKDEQQRWERIRKKFRRMRKKENVREVWETWNECEKKMREMRENNEKYWKNEREWWEGRMKGIRKNYGQNYIIHIYRKMRS